MRSKKQRRGFITCRFCEALFLLLFFTAGRLPRLAAQSAQPFAAKAAANDDPKVTIPLSLEKGTPLGVALDHRVPIRKKGEPVEGLLTEPVYSFDRIIAPAGAKVTGHLTEVEAVPRRRRAQAMLQGDFTPLRTAKVEFDTLVLKDGSKIPIKTLVSPGASEVVHLETAEKGKKKKQSAASKAIDSAKQQIKTQKDQVLNAIKKPGRLHRLKQMIIAELPYHRQYLPVGTRYTAELEDPVTLKPAQVPSLELKSVGTPPPAGSVVQAALLTALDSRTARRGTPVEAIVTRPVFAKDHQLIIPEGSKLEGMVVQAAPARRLRLRRNGILRFAFQRIQTPHGASQMVEGSLAGVVVDKNERVKLDAEGGAHSTNSKMDYAAPALAVMIAMSSAAPDQDVRPGRVYNDTQGPASNQIVGGGLGFGLIGTVLALAFHSQLVTAGLAAYGAGWSVYSHLLTRGQDVVFPKDTPMEIRFGQHRSTPPVPAESGHSPGLSTKSYTKTGELHE
jgi:hypothetical protein